MRAFAQINLSQFAVGSRGERSRLQQRDDSQISFLFLILIPLIFFVIFFVIESIDSIDEGENDMQVLLEKQDSQFTALTEALKDSLKDNGERRVGPAKLPGNPNKKRIISEQRLPKSLCTFRCGGRLAA